jgi:C_GCAxxG_C_C family probable redox protein
VGQKRLGVNDPALVKSMNAFGGGMVSSGGACGALAGGIALLGSVLGKDNPEEKDDPLMWKACREFYARFEREVSNHSGSVNCRDITGIDDWTDRKQRRAFYKGEGLLECRRNTGKAARILGEVIEKYIKDKPKV